MTAPLPHSLRVHCATRRCARMTSICAGPVALAVRECAATDTKVLLSLSRCLADPVARGHCVQEQQDNRAGYRSKALRGPAMIERSGEY
jgi:hypothetical protein